MNFEGASTMTVSIHEVEVVDITPAQALKNQYIRGQEELQLAIGKLIVGGGFLLVEDFIARDARLSYLYARDVKGGVFKAGEKVLDECDQWGPLYRALIKSTD